MKVFIGIIIITLSFSFSADAKKRKTRAKARKTQTTNHCANLLSSIPELSHYGEALQRNDGSIERYSSMNFVVANREVTTSARSSRRGKKDRVEEVSYKAGNDTLNIRFNHDNKGRCYPQTIDRNGKSIFEANTCRDANRWVRDYGKKLADCKRMGVDRKLKEYFSSLRGKDKAFADVKPGQENLEGELLKLHSKCKWPLGSRNSSISAFLKDKNILKASTNEYDFEKTETVN